MPAHISLGAAARSLYVVPPHADIDNVGQAFAIAYRIPRACAFLVDCHIDTMRGSHVVFGIMDRDSGDRGSTPNGIDVGW